MELPHEEFERIRAYVLDACGIALGESKAYLVQARLRPLLASEGCTSWAEFRKRLHGGRSSLRDEVIAAITTNETSFFRDSHPFEAFRNVILPTLTDLIRERKNRPYRRKGAKVRLWSAASSTGQEPYTLSMIIHDYVNELRASGDLEVEFEDFSILATDISPRVLAQAMAGEYSANEISRGLPKSFHKHFHKSGGVWYLEHDVRSIVEFRRLNLTDTFTSLGGFDFIACRNVLIYFELETKRNILRQFHQMLSPEGLLMLGHSENLYGLDTLFKPRRMGKSIVYRKL